MMDANNVKVVFGGVVFSGHMVECESYKIYLSNTKKGGFLGSSVELSFSGTMSVEDMNKITIALEKYKNKQLTIEAVYFMLRKVGFRE